jgi:anaerobic sulfite reductase subunit B
VRAEPTITPTPAGPLTPAVHRVIERRRETADVVTLRLEPVDGAGVPFRPGQFNMVSAWGVGEIAVSISGAPSEGGALRHTVRDVGAVSHALCECAVGDLVGVRGPFGTDWGIGAAAERSGEPLDTVVVAGGIGLAPLRGAVIELVGAMTPGGGRVVVLVGAREPAQLVFDDDMAAWRAAGAQVLVSVDRATPDWRGRVGLVTSLLDDAGFDPARSRALLCGPEVMMRFTARALVERGVDAASILVSLERNMQCGVGWCGHCQLGPLLVCRDGPVVPFGGLVAGLVTVRER